MLDCEAPLTSHGHSVSRESITTLTLDCPSNSAIQPVSVGIPLPRGQLSDRSEWRLRDANGREIAVQSETRSRWFDGSVRWLLLDFLAGPMAAGCQEWTLCSGAAPSTAAGVCSVREREREVSVDTGAATFRVVNSSGRVSVHVTMDNRDILDPNGLQIGYVDDRGRKWTPEFESAHVECSGPVRTTVRLEGRLPKLRHIRFVTRMCLFAGTSYLRVRHTIHNSRRARHRGNLWDLGDPGSERFRDLHLSLSLADTRDAAVQWSEHPDGPIRDAACQQRFEIYQESSGGENWRSRNHVNARGEVPLTLCGYRTRVNAAESFGQRATPIVTWRGPSASATVAVPDFWQQFPKAIEIDQRRLFVRLFPKQFVDGFELQGGEQKTHVVWFQFGRSSAPPDDLNWVHQPILARLNADCYASIVDLRRLVPGESSPVNRFDEYLSEVVAGPKSIFAKREVIDEYGWRNFGEIYADHENAYYPGPPPIISHYNNQFDSVFGALLQFVRTGDRRWRDIADPLARHVIDIDIYHTEEDRAAYRGGLFWMTDHYRDAATATHRTFSRANRAPGQSYGGGPGNEHNFTTGLLYYYFLTGDPLAHEAVVSLADWTIRRDDGRQAPFGWLDSGPTGLASFTTDRGYHGPGRGAGLSLNALLDGWLLTSRAPYLDYAEKLIRRCIHPSDDVASLDLMNAELRWSYTIFLAALSRYLRHKAEAQQIDFMYSYAQASLLRYAGWMVEHERPYFDQRSKLEYPTETWPAQEFRKANVMRQAAAHADEPLRSRLLTRGQQLADRAWSDLLSFESRHVARAVAIMMTEGNLDLWYRSRREESAPRSNQSHDFGSASRFVPRRERLRSLVRSPKLMAQKIVRLARRDPEPDC